MSKSGPIGIFDSGMGGLTVAQEIKRVMPNENIIYFGDTMHVPYGDKSKETVVEYSKAIAKFLLEKECKCIVMACNTASANAFTEVREVLPKDIPLFDVINPVANHVAYELHQKIAVIATKSTVNSNLYKKKIRKLNKHINVYEMATPLFVPIIEEGFVNSAISKAAIEVYFSNKKLKDIDTLILGCTHYPLIASEIEKFLEGKVKIVNSPLIVANSIKRKLIEIDLISNNTNNPSYTFFVSDLTKSFQKQAIRFFGQSISLTQIKLGD